MTQMHINDRWMADSHAEIDTKFQQSGTQKLLNLSSAHTASTDYPKVALSKTLP